MIDYYLKFIDKEQADSVIYTVTEEISKPNYTNIDVVGTIYSTPVEGEEPVAIDGYHVNVRVLDGEDASVLEQYAVVPANPKRIWG